jgi:hypothetical protein
VSSSRTAAQASRPGSTRGRDGAAPGTKTPSLPVLRKIARVLGVRTSALIGEAPSEDHEGPVNPRLAELERALVTYRTLALSDVAEVPELGELAQQIRAGWDA